MTMILTENGSGMIEPDLLELICTETDLTLRLHVPRSLTYFRGHFPGFSILPGVVQLSWVMRYARRYLLLSGRAAWTMQVKFHRPILPGTEIDMVLSLLADGRMLNFVCRNQKEIFSSGRIELGAP